MSCVCSTSTSRQSVPQRHTPRLVSTAHSQHATERETRASSPHSAQAHLLYKARVRESTIPGGTRGTCTYTRRRARARARTARSQHAADHVRRCARAAAATRCTDHRRTPHHHGLVTPRQQAVAGQTATARRARLGAARRRECTWHGWVVCTTGRRWGRRASRRARARAPPPMRRRSPLPRVSTQPEPLMR